MNRVVYSRTKVSNDNYETPLEFVRKLELVFGFQFTLDPFATKANAKAPKFFTKEQNGLNQSWAGERVFVNPPFSLAKDTKKRKGAVWKCFHEGNKPNTVVCLILPPRTDTEYWHDYIMNAKEIWFCKGRVNFLLNGVKPKNGAAFPLVVILFGDSSIIQQSIDFSKTNGKVSSLVLEPYRGKVCSFQHITKKKR